MLINSGEALTNELTSAQVLFESGEYEDALKKGVELLGQSVSNPEIWKLIAEALYAKNGFLEASEAIQTAISLSPTDTTALLLLGKIQRSQGKIPESIETFRSILAIDEHCLTAMREMHNSILRLGVLDTNSLIAETNKCIRLHEKSLIADPTRIDLYHSLSHLYICMGRSADSVILLTQLCNILPDCPTAKFNLAMAYKDSGRLDEALRLLGEIDPPTSDFAAKIGHSTAHMEIQKLNFSKGWELYEARWEDEHFPSKNLQELNKSIPHWNGEIVGSLLIWAEQGIGDEVMFSSVLVDANSRCEVLTVACDERLIPVFRRSFPSDINFVPKRSKAIKGVFDAQLPMGSLPKFFRRCLEDFSIGELSFLKPDQAVVSKIRKNIAPAEREVVGISWFSNSTNHTRLIRNSALKNLIDLVGNQDRIFVCLQYGDVDEEIKSLEFDANITVLNPDDIDQKLDINNLCNLIAACDRVVSVDNVTVHLSGALGVPTTLLLPAYPDWRWGGREQGQSYWYPSLGFHEQSAPGRWPPLS